MISSIATRASAAPFVGRRARPAPSSRALARVGATLLVLLTFINSSTFRRTDVETYQFDWHIALRILLCFACGLYGLYNLRKTSATIFRGPGMFVVGFACCAAVLLPFAMMPVNAAGAVLCLWCVILFAAAIKENLEPPQIIKYIAATLVVFLTGSWVAYFFIPSIGREILEFPDGATVERFGGLGSSQMVGLMSALTIALLLILGSQRVVRWRVLLLPMVLAAATMIMTNSRTSMLAAVAAVILTVFRSLRPAKAAVLVFLVGPLIVVFGIALLSSGVLHVNEDQIFSKLSRSGESSEIENISGRLDIWAFFIDKFFEAPITGYGLSCARFVPHEAYLHAHNQFLNLLVETGVFGVFFALLQYLVLASDPGSNRYYDLVFLFVFIGGLTERVIYSPIPDCITVLWLLALFTSTRGLCRSSPGRIPTKEYACLRN